MWVHIFWMLRFMDIKLKVPYKGCLESICPFLISWKLVKWPWCNLAASQRRPYCATINNHSPTGLVSRQWDATDWVVYCVTVKFTMTEWADQFHHNNVPAHSTAFVQAPPYTPDLAPCYFWLFPKLKSLLKGRRFVSVMVTQYTKTVNGVSLPTD